MRRSFTIGGTEDGDNIGTLKLRSGNHSLSGGHIPKSFVTFRWFRRCSKIEAIKLRYFNVLCMMLVVVNPDLINFIVGEEREN
jgi:hypothetical protein